MSDSAHAEHGFHPNYVKVWAILVLLLGVSVIGPEFGIRAVTLFTAFGVAIIKAYLVAANFMHLKVEKKYVIYLFMTCLFFMGLLFFGSSADIMKHGGRNWSKQITDEPDDRHAGAIIAAAAARHGGAGHSEAGEGTAGSHDGSQGH